MRGLTAKDIMSSEVITVDEEMTVQELTTVLRENEISGAPVRDSQGKVIGVVSFTDIASRDSANEIVAPDRSNPEFFVHGWEERLNPDELRQLHIETEGLVVRDIMTPTVFAVAEDTSIPEIAQSMVSGHVHRILVTREDRVVGIISSLDMLRLLLEPR